MVKDLYHVREGGREGRREKLSFSLYFFGKALTVNATLNTSILFI